MTGVQILGAVIEILVGGIVRMGEAIGGGLSSLAESLFLTTVGGTTTLSTFGALIVVFAGVALAMSLSRWVVNFVTSLGSRNQ